MIDLSQKNDTNRSWRVTADGELWEVRRSAWQYHFAWLSGIAADYGFTSRLNDPEFVLSSAGIESTIREFMSNVNPDAGNLD